MKKIIKSTAFLLMFITIISKILGFLREIALGYYYGASSVSDAFLISLTIPGVIYSFIGAALATGFVPLYQSIKIEDGRKKADEFTNNVINLLFVFSTLIIVLTIIFTEPIVKAFASGFDSETLDLCVMFTRIFVTGVYFSGLIFIYTSYLQVYNSFLIPVLLGIPFNIISILAIVFGAYYNNVYLIIGTLFAKIFEFVVLYPFIKKIGFKHQFNLKIRDENLIKMALMTLPLTLGISLNQINILIDRTLASQIAEGGISILNYSSRLNLFVQGVFITSLLTILYPKVSGLIAEKKIENVKTALWNTMSQFNIFLIPSTLVLCVFSKDITYLLYGNGSFSNDDLEQVSSTLLLFSVSMIAVGYRELFSKIFYAMQNTKTPTVNALLGLLMNIVLNLLFYKKFGLNGLAFATSISAILTSILLYLSLKKVLELKFNLELFKNFIKILFSSLILVFVMKFFVLILDINEINKMLSFILATIIGAICYLLSIYLMRIPQVINLFKKS